MWMKLIFFSTLIFPYISFCDRRKRETILIGEARKILEAFHFSNLDRQETLDGIDKQKFGNLDRKKKLSQQNSGDWNEYLKQYNADSYLTGRNEFPDGVQLKNTENLFGENWFENSKYYSPTECFVREKKDAVPEDKTEKLNGTTTESYGDGDDNDDDADAEDNDFEDYDDEEDTRKKRRRKKKKKRHHHWGKWTRWSPCSVTCGKGRKIRHRKCIAKVCRTGEIEMGEKACQLPACSLLDKILSIF